MTQTLHASTYSQIKWKYQQHLTFPGHFENEMIQSLKSSQQSAMYSRYSRAYKQIGILSLGSKQPIWNAWELQIKEFTKKNLENIKGLIFHMLLSHLQSFTFHNVRSKWLYLFLVLKISKENKNLILFDCLQVDFKGLLSI